MESANLAVLFVPVAVTFAVVEKLTHQGEDHAVGETQARFDHIDVVLIARFRFALRQRQALFEECLTPEPGRPQLA